MKHIYTILLIISSTILLSQAPQSFSYQAVVRDATGDIIASSSVSLRISILAASAQGQPIYTETHFASTNQFGLISVNIGQGTTTYGMFDTIPWNNNSFFIQTELDATGGANYVLMGTTQILSVPYAIYGRDEDYDPANEIQILSTSNDSINLTQSNQIEIPQGYPGELRMFAVSISGAITKQSLQQKGWAVCDGSTPSSQGITNALLVSTPDLSNKFIKMSGDETSGTIGGKAMAKWAYSSGNNRAGLAIDLLPPGYYTATSYSYNANGGSQVFSTNGGSPTQGDKYTETNEPPYYEALFFIKVK